MIRKACSLDAFALVELGIAYQREAMGHDRYLVDEDVVMQKALAAIRDPDSCVLVAIQGFSVVGFIYAVKSTFIWSTVPIAVDQLLYIAPEYRGSLHGVSLIRGYERWAKDNGIAEVRISIASGITETRTRKLYKALGYEPLGYVYRKELQSGKLTITTSTSDTGTETR